MIRCYCKSLIVLVVFVSSLAAQSNNTSPPVSTLVALLAGSLESKTATAGQEFTLTTITDVVVEGLLVIPKGSRVLGHVTEALTKGKDQKQSALLVVIDKAVRRDGSELPLQAIIAALAAPQNASLADDPTYGMMHSNEPAQSGASAPAASNASSTASVATARLKGDVDVRINLDENSRGTIGYEDLSLSWQLMAPPAITVIASRGKNVKLRPGTQVLLRMAPPRPRR